MNDRDSMTAVASYNLGDGRKKRDERKHKNTRLRYIRNAGITYEGGTDKIALS